MNGHELYNKYISAMAEQRIDVDPWDTLGPSEQHAWEELAQEWTEELAQAEHQPRKAGERTD